jgi:hypothetical protein
VLVRVDAAVFFSVERDVELVGDRMHESSARSRLEVVTGDVPAHDTLTGLRATIDLGTLMAYQPYGTPGLLVADIDLTAATRLLATRCKPL